MTKGLTGIPSLAYLGVNAGSPPNIKMYNRAPTQYDYQNFIIGDLWINTTPTPAALRELYMLVAVISRVATWIKLYPISGGGGGNLRSDDLSIEAPDPETGAINVYGGEPYLGDPAYINMYTNRLNAYTLYVNLKRSINQPNTNATATEGMYKLGSSDFMHNFGTNNTALGHGTLNLTLTTALAQDNTALGHGALNSVVNAFSCTACGSGALTGLEDGQYVTALGFEAGKNLDGADSDDIMIGSPGVLGDLNCIRIGQGGVGANQQDKLFIPAVWEGVAEPGVATGLTIVNANGKMYVDVIDPDSVLMTDATGNPIGVKGAIGTVFTGQGAGLADPAPAFLPITSSGGTVTISTDPITNAINLEAAGVAGLVQLTTDAGVALPLAGNINVLGGELVKTDAAVANTVTVNLTRGADGQIIVGNTAAASTYRDLICSDGSLSVDFSNPAQVDITVIGVPPVGGVNALYDHALLSVPPTLNHIQIEQGANITTVGDVPTSKITVSVTDDVDLPLGHLSARDDVTTTAGDLIASAGNLELPNSNGTATEGVIKLGGSRWSHNLLGTWLGHRTGNFAATTAMHNLGLGYAVLENVVSGQYNSFGGFASGLALTSGSNNTGWGRYSLRYLTTGNRNQAFGSYSGFNYTGAESDNILIGSKGEATTDSHVLRIGIHGTGDYQQSDCYIAGIRDSAAGTSPEMVVIGTVASGYKVWSQPIPSSAAGTFVTDSGTATVSGTTLQIKGGDNIHTTGATNVVTVHLDRSIMQDMTDLAGGGTGFYSLFARGSTAYSTYRFMHAYGTTCAYLGLGAGSISSSSILSCVGIGTAAMPLLQAGAYNNNAIGKESMKVATTAKNCICLGTLSGSALTTSTASILIGSSAGANYDTESYNIILGGVGGSTAGDASVAGDTRKMYLGYKQVINPATGAITTHGTDDTYIYGIYNRTIASTATPVYVDHLGKLGTAGSCAFAFHLINNLSNITGDGTLYSFGSTTGSVGVEFDKTSALTIGGAGSPTVFTAPYDGRYQFSATVTYIIPGTMPPPAVVLIDPLYMVITPLDHTDPAKSKMFTAYLPDPEVGTDQYVSEIVTTLVELSAGDTVYWACQTSGGTKRIGLMANRPGGGGLPLLWATYFSGSKVS